jgi:hypothetical protein
MGGRCIEAMDRVAGPASTSLTASKAIFLILLFLLMTRHWSLRVGMLFAIALPGRSSLSALSNAPLTNDEAETFKVIHPFHPLHGQTFTLITYKHAWGENRVYYHNDSGKLCSLPASWTSVLPLDPVIVISGGRSPFRLSDLLELSRLLSAVVFLFILKITAMFWSDNVTGEIIL